MGEKKLGRPTDNPKEIVLKIRLDKGSEEMLKECRDQMKLSKAEIIRRGIKLMHDGLEK
ncbi:ribbon-helix-helix domain-containing protein [Anaeromassilibacillus senegalensis]|uniref:hypothetical protein n=1 Tax=Anaeromassilibacillus senegalensis TaxID=1673717 RepID=UPI00068235A6|nr:hypothetical protein [Anaeromassilibacillus senegalensis]